MGLDEKLFAFGYRLFQKLTAEALPPFYEHRADLKEIEPRLHIIAKSLCGEPIQIHEAERIGGFSGIHFYYPKSLCPLPSKKLNELIYIQRTLFYSSAKQLGFCLPPRELSDIEKKVYTCLAIHQVNQYISLEFPGSTTVMETLSRETKEELKSLSGQSRNTQNGILAQWIYEILSGEFSAPWKNILLYPHKNAFSFWKFADSIYKEHLASLPEGPPLADEAFVLWGILMAPQSLSAQEETSSYTDATKETLPTGTEIQGRNREEIVKVNLDDSKEEKNPILHSFEKMETLEEYQGGMRTEDGDDDLEDHAEALNELNMREVTRSRERTNSLYKADIRLNGLAPDLLSQDDLPQAQNIYLYPEWDFRKKSYKTDWCRVEVRSSGSGAAFQLSESYFREKKEILKLFEQVRHSPIWKKRQTDGSELDIDALVNRHAELKNGNTSQNRFYLRSQKHKKNWECLLLIDASLSTDSWVANERILDVIKNSVCLIGDALLKEEGSLSVAAFHSNTRHQCVFQELKNFKHSWRHLKSRLGPLEPSGYTRIGPALRHSLELFKKSSARHKVVVLLSDGKASDYDHYEGRYGMEDVKQVVREARQQQVHIKCLAVEEQAKFYLPQMFGASNIQILANPHKLPRALSSLLLPLLR